MASRRTLLEITQNILVSLDGDKVSTILETAESESVADIVRQCYFSLTAELGLQGAREMAAFTAYATLSPIGLQIDPEITDVTDVRYNHGTVTSPRFVNLTYASQEEFMDLQQNLGPIDGVTIGSVTYTPALGGSIVIPFYKNAHPTMYTTLKDRYVIVNSYNAAVDVSGVSATKTIGFATASLPWTHTDSFVPPFDNKFNELLFAKAKMQCFSELKQVENSLSVKDFKKAKVTLRKDGNPVAPNDYYKEYPSYGRK